MDMGRGREEGEGRTHEESGLEIYTVTHVKQRASGSLLCGSGKSNQAL